MEHDNPLVQCEGCLGWVHAVCGIIPKTILDDPNSHWHCSGCTAASTACVLLPGKSTCATCPYTGPAVMVADPKSGHLVHLACVMYTPEFNYNFTTGSFTDVLTSILQNESMQAKQCFYCQRTGGAIVSCSVREVHKGNQQNQNNSMFHPLCAASSTAISAPHGRFRLATLPSGLLRMCLCDDHAVHATVQTWTNLRVELIRERRRINGTLASSSAKQSEETLNDVGEISKLADKIQLLEQERAALMEALIRERNMCLQQGHQIHQLEHDLGAFRQIASANPAVMARFAELERTNAELTNNVTQALLANTQWMQAHTFAQQEIAARDAVILQISTTYPTVMQQLFHSNTNA